MTKISAGFGREKLRREEDKMVNTIEARKGMSESSLSKKRRHLRDLESTQGGIVTLIIAGNKRISGRLVFMGEDGAEINGSYHGGSPGHYFIGQFGGPTQLKVEDAQKTGSYKKIMNPKREVVISPHNGSFDYLWDGVQ